MSLDHPLSYELAMHAAHVTELAALASFHQIGMGDEKAADQVAVDAMRRALNAIPMQGRIVIGEGERDEAPMLYIGELVGTGSGCEIDIALDPLEGTTLTAKAMPNALCVLAMAPRDGLLHAPDTYMDKIAIGANYEQDLVDLDRSPTENVQRLAKAKGVDVREIGVCVLDRPRHQALIGELRALGTRIFLITDGDVAGVMHTTDPELGIDLYMGLGGAPEGVLAAAALRCVGGQMQGRLHFRNAEEKARATRIGIRDWNRKYQLDDLVPGHAIFAASGVTKGALLGGVVRVGDLMQVETMILNSADRSKRLLLSEIAVG